MIESQQSENSGLNFSFSKQAEQEARNSYYKTGCTPERKKNESRGSIEAVRSYANSGSRVPTVDS